MSDCYIEPCTHTLFGHVCTLNKEKISSCSMSAEPQHQVSIIYETNVEQLNHNFCLRLHQKLSQSTKIPNNFWGRGRACPQTLQESTQLLLNVIINVAPPPTFHDLPTPLKLVILSHTHRFSIDTKILVNSKILIMVLSIIFKGTKQL